MHVIPVCLTLSLVLSSVLSVLTDINYMFTSFFSRFLSVCVCVVSAQLSIPARSFYHRRSHSDPLGGAPYACAPLTSRGEWRAGPGRVDQTTMVRKLPASLSIIQICMQPNESTRARVPGVIVIWGWFNPSRVMCKNLVTTCQVNRNTGSVGVRGKDQGENEGGSG